MNANIPNPGGTAQRIKDAMVPLVGTELSGWSRALDLACFDFGPQRVQPSPRGGTRKVGEYALHIQCGWRFLCEDRTLVASGDLAYPAAYDHAKSSVPPDFDWEREPNRLDRLLVALFEGQFRGVRVQSVEAGGAGAFRLDFNRGLSLEVWPDTSLDIEHWRLFQPGYDGPHFVIRGQGIEE